MKNRSYSTAVLAALLGLLSSIPSTGQSAVAVRFTGAPGTLPMTIDLTPGSGCAPMGTAGQILVTTGAGDCTPTTPTISGSTITATLSGNASTATALATPRAIYGNNFDGTAALTQIIASTYGGTGNGFTKFSGPATSEKTFTLPNANATLLYDGGALGTPASGTATNITGLPEGGLSLTDITTNNSSTSKHGFLPKLDNNSAHYLNGQGGWTTPPGGGTGCVPSGIVNQVLVDDGAGACSSTSVTIDSTSGAAGAVDMPAGTVQAIGANSFGIGAGATMTTSQRLESPNAVAVAHSVMIIGAPSSNISTWAYKAVPDCTDTGGNHLNFTQSTDAFSCGTSGGSSAFSEFINTQSAVSMDGTDVAIFSTSAPALAAGKCYKLEFVIGEGLSSGGVKLKADATTLSTFFTSATANVVVMTVYYCNNPASQAAQTIWYPIPPNYAASPSTMVSNGWINTSTGTQTETPTGVDWSSGHTITITVNQASGTVVPLAFLISTI